MTDVKWIKIVTDIFDDEKMLLIDSYPERDAIIVIWFKLLCLAGKQNNGGVFMINDRIPYTDEMLSVIFRRPLNTIRLALSVFEQYGMIEIIDNVITIPNWEKHQSLEELERKKENRSERNKRYYEKKKQELIESKDNKTSYKTDLDDDLRCLKTPLDKIREDKIREDENGIVPNGTLVQTEPEEIDIRPVNPPKKILSLEQTKRFEAFWKAYPKRQSKATAEKAWSKILPDDFEMNVILQAIEQAKQKDSRFRDMQYIPLPATWLNARSWENEYEDEQYQPPQQAMERPQRSAGMGSFDADEFFNAAINRRRKG